MGQRGRVAAGGRTSAHLEGARSRRGPSRRRPAVRREAAWRFGLARLLRGRAASAASRPRGGACLLDAHRLCQRVSLAGVRPGGVLHRGALPRQGRRVLPPDRASASGVGRCHHAVPRVLRAGQPGCDAVGGYEGAQADRAAAAYAPAADAWRRTAGGVRPRARKCRDGPRHRRRAARGAGRLHDPAHRGKRRRQGTNRALHPRGIGACRRAVRRDQLRRGAREPARVGAVRSRPRVVHGRHPGPHRPVRGRQQRHAAARRDRRSAAADAGEAAPGAAGASDPPGRREPKPLGHRAGHRGDQS